MNNHLKTGKHWMSQFSGPAGIRCLLPNLNRGKSAFSAVAGSIIWVMRLVTKILQVSNGGLFGRAFCRGVGFALAWSALGAVGAGLSLTTALAKSAPGKSSWEFQHKGADYRVIETDQGHQIFMAICCAYPHLILNVRSPYKQGKDAVESKFRLLFSNGADFLFDNANIIFDKKNVISFESNIPKKYLETFLRAVGASSSLVVSYPGSTLKNYRFNLQGAYPSLLEMAMKLKDKGIFDMLGASGNSSSKRAAASGHTSQFPGNSGSDLKILRLPDGATPHPTAKNSVHCSVEDSRGREISAWTTKSACNQLIEQAKNHKLFVSSGGSRQVIPIARTFNIRTSSAMGALVWCQSTNGVATMKSEIPKILGLGPDTATITHIRSVSVNAFDVVANETLWGCYAYVFWSNDVTELGTFAVGTNPYGKSTAYWQHDAVFPAGSFPWSGQ